MYHVLYVDDEPPLLDIGKIFLEKTHEIEVTPALSAVAGLDLLSHHTFDAIVSDYQMPGMDGIAFLKKVRERCGDIPFVLFTGKGREEVVIEAITHGVDFYLQKGGDPRAQYAELAHKVKTAIERKRAIASLTDSEGRLRRAEIVAQLGHWEFHMDTGKMTASAGAAAIYGLKSLELPISDVQKIPLPEYRGILDTALHNLITLKKPYDLEFRIRQPDTGELRDIHSVASYDPERRVVFGVIHDITERKQTECELRAMNEQLAAAQEELRSQYDALAAAQREIIRRQQQIEGIAATVPGVVYQVRAEPGDRIGVAYVNTHAGESIFGLDYTDDDFFRWFAGHVHPSDRNPFIASVYGAVNEGVGWNYEGRFVKPTGEIIWFQGIGSPVVRGREWVYSGVLLDVTERKRQEHILEAQLALGLELQKLHGLRESLDACLAMAIDVSAMDAGGIYLVDEVSGSVDLAVSRNLGDPFVRSVSHYPADSINAQIVAAGKPIYGQTRKTGLVPDAIYEREGVRAIAIIPISFGNRVTACLNITSHIHEEIPATARIALETIANQIGAAIERIRSEAMIRERENKYRALVETTRTGYVIIDECGRVLDANTEYVRLTGHTELEEITCRNVLEWTADYDKEKNTGAVRQCLRDGFVRNLEIDYTDTCGKITPVELNATVIGTEETQILTLCRDISERREIQSALRESEEKYRTLVEHSQDGVFIAQDSRLAFYNRAFAEMSGYGENELIGHPITEVIAPEDREMVVSRHQERIAGKRLPETYDFSMLHKDKTTRIRMRMLVGLGTYKGRPATIGTLHNITGHRQREDALRESEERHRLLADNATDVIWTMDLVGHFTYVSPSVEKLRGYTAEEVMKQSLDEVLTPDSAAIAARELAVISAEIRAGRRIPGYRGEFEQRCRDGSTVWTDVTTTGIYNAAGEFVAILGVTRDITDRKRLEEALQESESKFRSIFNSTSDAIQIIGIGEDGLPGKYIEMNDVGCRMLQYSREELRSMSPLDIATEFGQLEEARKALTTRGYATFETRYRRKDGSVLPVEVSARVATIEGKTVAVSVVRDVTERKRAEDSLRLANHKLNLLSSVTRHDVLNQLMALKGFVDLSAQCGTDEKFGPLHAKEEKIIGRIERQILFTKEYQDIGIHAPAWQNVEKALRTAVQGLDLTGIDLHEELAGLEVLADPLLQKVFFNLTENARRHGGDAMKQIGFSSFRAGDALVIVCEDDGLGIPERVKERIFERGYGKNTGFGLFLIREILAITGITVRETGEAGKGARFEILVPAGMFRCAGR